MGGEELRVVPYERRFERDLVEICWRTGFMGESLEGLGRFEDRRLFALLFVLQFPRSWPELVWVAVQGEPGRERAVGYIVGAADAAAQARAAARLSWRWRILARALLISSWRHPESFRQLLGFGRAEGRILWEEEGYRREDYPACLHINLLPECQGRGAGGRLMEALLAELRRRNIGGVHLETSDRNLKALPFYRKLGFRLVREAEGEFWAGAPARGLEFALSLD